MVVLSHQFTGSFMYEKCQLVRQSRPKQRGGSVGELADFRSATFAQRIR
jgi:hypothetical protein